MDDYKQASTERGGGFTEIIIIINGIVESSRDNG